LHHQHCQRPRGPRWSVVSSPASGTGAPEIRAAGVALRARNRGFRHAKEAALGSVSLM
jgi:hypothetical protein